MSDWVKVVQIGTVGIVTVLSFLLMPESSTIHNVLVYGLLSLAGVHAIGAAGSAVINKISRRE